MNNKTKKPNIVMLVNDHQAFYRHGWDDEYQPRRPAFDRLASGGVTFDRTYSACPLCTPARRTMMTGLLPHNHGYLTLDPAQNGPGRDVGDLFERLGDAGYDLNYFGKWHAGPGTAADHGCHGYSYPGYGNPYITKEYRQYCERLGISEASFNLEHIFIEPISPDNPKPGPGYQPKAPHNHTHLTGVMETERAGHEADFIAHLACERLDEIAASASEKPFFLRVDFYGPHAPYMSAQEFLDMYSPEDIQEYGSFNDDLSGKPAVYRKEWNSPLCEDLRLIIPNAKSWSEWQRIMAHVYAHITQVDAAGGKILDSLDRLALTDDTVVVWTTDHGDPIAAHGGHFGKESFLSEEAIRIPFAMRWPGHVAAGQRSDSLVSQADVPVTLLDCAETAFSGDVDGASLLELLDAEGTVNDNGSWRKEVVVETHGHHWEKVVGRAVVTRDAHFARYFYLETPDFVREGDQIDNMEELYYLGDDPYQLNNLAADVGCQDDLHDMRQRLEVFRKKSRDPYPLYDSELGSGAGSNL